MAIQGFEWVVIAIIVIVLIMWGPRKIPELARALGKAKKEFQEGVKEGENMASLSGDALIDTARKLGIDTEGKTKDQISEEIIKKTQNKAS
jgi:sec-independent protein translocase protein TatA